MFAFDAPTTTNIKSGNLFNDDVEEEEKGEDQHRPTIDPTADFEIIDSSDVPSAEEAERELKEIEEDKQRKLKEEKEESIDGGICKYMQHSKYKLCIYCS